MIVRGVKNKHNHYDSFPILNMAQQIRNNTWNNLSINQHSSEKETTAFSGDVCNVAIVSFCILLIISELASLHGYNCRSELGVQAQRG